MTKQGQALYVGIQRYEHHEDLRCCRADAEAMAGALRFDCEGHPNWETTVLVDGAGDVVDGKSFRDEVGRMLRTADHDNVLLYYSGHAFRLDDGDLLLASYEDDPSAADEERAGLRFSELVRDVRDHEGMFRSVVVILDCCNAGALAGVDLPRDMAVLAAARDGEAARESGAHGRFTDAMLMCLDGASADVYGNVSVVSLFSNVSAALAADGRGAQRPMLKAFLDRDIVLKRTRTGITEEMMTRLVEAKDPRGNGTRPVFASAASVFKPYAQMEAPLPADGGRPSRSPDDRPEDFTPHQKLMDEMKTWRNAYLIDIVNEKGEPTDLFWAVVDGGSIRLTPRGAYYFDLMKRQSGMR
ncbi:caspase family protein [Bifidobacterium platyrrhinorum]|nr:caspase family protein [Bifidobacterium platyrrhinorum]